MKNKKVNILGLTIYERETSSSKIENIKTAPLVDKYTGLLFTASIPNLRFRSHTFSEDYEWQNLAISIITLSVHSMFKSNLISIKQITKQTFFINKIFKSKKDTFYIQKKDDLQKDIIVNRILLSIKNSKDVSSHLLGTIIKNFLDQELGSKEIDFPEKAFIMLLLDRYSKKYSWINYEISSHFILSNKYNLSIDDDFKEKINQLFKAVQKDLIESQIQSEKYSNFIKSLQEILKNEFEKRHITYHDT